MDRSETTDRILNGRLTIVQPSTGYRAAIDPVLLAAACPALPGDHVLDAGCGVGTAGLCVLARVNETRAMGIELQSHLAGLAMRNAVENGWAERFEVVNDTILSSRGLTMGSRISPPVSPDHAVKPRDDIDRLDWRERVRFHHVICNPPYLPEGYGSGKPSLANNECDAKLTDWVDFAAKRVRPGGSAVFIHRADRLDALLPLMAAQFGALVIYPLWPRAGEAAKRVIVGGIKGRRTPLRLAAGLNLHRQDESYTGEADAILRDAEAINLW